MAAPTNTDLDVAIAHALTFNTTISALSNHHLSGVSIIQWPRPPFPSALASSAAEATDTSIARPLGESRVGSIARILVHAR